MLCREDEKEKILRIMNRDRQAIRRTALGNGDSQWLPSHEEGETFSCSSLTNRVGWCNLCCANCTNCHSTHKQK